MLLILGAPGAQQRSGASVKQRWLVPGTLALSLAKGKQRRWDEKQRVGVFFFFLQESAGRDLMTTRTVCFARGDASLRNTHGTIYQFQRHGWRVGCDFIPVFVFGAP